MRTPGGAECALYYEDFARGAARQECRAPKGRGSAFWQPGDCARCPVPVILADNGSPHLELLLTIHPGPFGARRRVTVTARCALHGLEVREPRTGCPACNADADELLRSALGGS